MKKHSFSGKSISIIRYQMKRQRRNGFLNDQNEKTNSGKAYITALKIDLTERNEIFKRLQKNTIHY